MSSILHSCLEESEEIEQELLDVLLTPLLPSSKSENVAAYTLVAHVLRACPAATQATISSFLNNVLVGAPTGTSGKGGNGESELADHIYPLIYELHKVSPELLLKVLPNICVQLQAEDEDIRLKAVKLLGRLFASVHASYGTDFTVNFKEFLGRFLDVSATVRMEMVDCGSLIMKRKPELRQLTMDHVVQRLKDNEAEVRQNTLQQLLEIAIEDPMRLSASAISEIGSRARDKRSEIRKVALIGMGKMFQRHISGVLPELDSLKDLRKQLNSTVPPGLMERLSIVPGLIVKCWSYPEQTTKHLVVNLMQEYILPKSGAVKIAEGADSPENEDEAETSLSSAQTKTKKKSSGGAKGKAPTAPTVDIDSRRLFSLLVIMDMLDEQDKMILSNILCAKSKVRAALIAFLDARESSNSFHVSDSLKSCMVRLLKELPANDKKGQQMLERLHVMKDKNVFKLLRQATRAEDDIIVSLQNRDDLKGRVDSRSALGEYVGRLFDTAGYLVVNENMAELCLQMLSESPPEISGKASAMLASVVKHCPRAFEHSADGLQQWLEMLKASKSRSSVVRPLIGNAVTIVCKASSCLSLDAKCGDLCTNLLSIAKQETHGPISRKIAEAVTLLSCLMSARAARGTTGTSSGKSKKQPAYDQSAPLEAVLSVVANLTTSKKLSTSNPRLATDLDVLAGLLASPLVPAVFDSGVSHGDVMSAFNVLVQRQSSALKKATTFIRHDLLRGGEQVGEEACAAIAAWTAGVAAQEESREIADSSRNNFDLDQGVNAEDDDDSVADSGLKAIRGAPPDVTALVECLFDCLEADGAKAGDAEVPSSSLRLRVFEAAALCCFQLIKRPLIGRQLTTDAWKKLGWTLLHAEEAVREKLAKELFVTLQTTSIHPRFLVYPLLLSTDSAHHTFAEQLLFFNISRLRRTHDLISQRALVEENESLAAKAKANMPENLLPFVLYLLSYHPEFPTSTNVESDADKRKLRKMATVIRTAVKVLVETLSGEENNIAFLLKQANMIQGHYEDKHDEENLGLHFVTRLTTKILNERVRTDDNVQEYRGDVSLPMDLYKLRTDAVKPGLRGALGDTVINAVQEGMLEAESAIDRALGIGKAKRTSGGGSKRFSGGGSKRQSTLGGRKKDTSVVIQGDGDEGGAAPAGNAKGKARVKRAKSPQPEAEAERKMPRRGAKDAVTVYEDEDENEEEVEQWEALAAQRQQESLNRSLVSPPRTSLASSDFNARSFNSDSADEAERGDFDATGDDKEIQPPVKRGSAPKRAVKVSKKNSSKQAALTSFGFAAAATSKENGDVAAKGAKSRVKAKGKTAASKQTVKASKERKTKLLR